MPNMWSTCYWFWVINFLLLFLFFSEFRDTIFDPCIIFLVIVFIRVNGSDLGEVGLEISLFISFFGARTIFVCTVGIISFAGEPIAAGGVGGEGYP